ncbi:MAG: vWA domain-containing protein [Candidatus Methanosuratincola petrocarbonis]
MVEQENKALAEILLDPNLFKETLKKAEETEDKLSAALFLFTVQGVLTDQQKRLARATLIRLLMELASKISAKGTRSTEMFRAQYKPGLEDISIEETMESTVSKGVVCYEDLVMIDKRQKKRGFALILDTSNSMQREKLVLSILAVCVLAYCLKGEEYAIITFNTEAKVLKDIKEEMTIEELLETVLEIKPENATNIRVGLEKGFEQLSKSSAHEKVGVLVTDGWATVGEDPVEIASKFPRLHVIQAPFGFCGGDEEMCNRIAVAGRGKRIYVEKFEELPGAILQSLIP